MDAASLCFGIYPTSGFRAGISGGLSVVGTHGYFWCSSPFSATHAEGLNLYFISSGMNSEGYATRAFGFPVRCVQE